MENKIRFSNLSLPLKILVVWAWIYLGLQFFIYLVGFSIAYLDIIGVI